MTKEQRTCHVCGVQTKDSARFCQDCGALLLEHQEENLKMEEPAELLNYDIRDSWIEGEQAIFVVSFPLPTREDSDSENSPKELKQWYTLSLPRKEVIKRSNEEDPLLIATISASSEELEDLPGQPLDLIQDSESIPESSWENLLDSVKNIIVIQWVHSGLVYPSLDVNQVFWNPETQDVALVAPVTPAQDLEDSSFLETPFSLYSSLVQLRWPEQDLNLKQREEQYRKLLTSYQEEPKREKVEDAFAVLNLEPLPAASKSNSETQQLEILADNHNPEQKEARVEFLGWGYSDVGNRRSMNQDAALVMHNVMVEQSVEEQTLCLAAIDGMGGEAEGEMAASIVTRTLARLIPASLNPLPLTPETQPLDPPPADSPHRGERMLSESLKLAHENIRSYALKKPQERLGMGCTATVALLKYPHLTLAQVGDTRGYLVHEGSAKQVTEDHSLVAELVRLGKLTAEEARTSPHKNIVARALGAHEQIEVDTFVHPISIGDRVFLMSDGIWESLTEPELLGLLESPLPLKECLKQLLDRALELGGDDNLTVVGGEVRSGAP